MITFYKQELRLSSMPNTKLFNFDNDTENKVNIVACFMVLRNLQVHDS